MAMLGNCRWAHLLQSLVLSVCFPRLLSVCYQVETSHVVFEVPPCHVQGLLAAFPARCILCAVLGSGGLPSFGGRHSQGSSRVVATTGDANDKRLKPHVVL